MELAKQHQEQYPYDVIMAIELAALYFDWTTPAE